MTLLVAKPAKLTTILVATVSSVVMHVMGPWQLGRATDQVYAGVTSHSAIDSGQLARLLAFVALLYAGASALNWWQAWLSTGLLQGIVRALRQQSEDKLARLPLAWFDQQPRGEVLSRVTNDIDNISQSLQQLLSQLLMSLLSLVGVLTMMLILSPRLTLIGVAAVMASVALAALLTVKSQPKFTEQWQATGVLNGEIEEGYTGHTLIKVFRHQAAARAQFDQGNAALYSSSLAAQAVSGAVQPAILFIGNLVFTGVALVGGLSVIGGQVTLGLLQAFVQYARQLTQPLSQMSSMTGGTQSGLASLERVFELLDAPELSPEAAQPVATPPPSPSAAPNALAGPPHLGHVEFDAVSFRYRPDQPLFEGVSLQALPGQTVAIVGPTGAGKTTLMNLLLRFYEIDSGCIRLDGIDIRTLTREALRSHFGVVPQETWLFAGSIHDNIAYGHGGPTPATTAEVLAAATACHVDEFVRLLPGGYGTLIDENGGGLSAGQQQLLTIARAFIAQPVVLILDEATSSVDTHTERLVQQAMAQLRAGRTSFVIAHRLSTILDADLIAYMESGNVVEQGSHAVLMAAKGRYWALYESQFSSDPVGAGKDEGAPQSRSPAPPLAMS
jgi:ATP-binding cassette subfamily B multidrug efflux pump